MKSHVNLFEQDCYMDGVINRYTWHKECVTYESLQKLLAIKPYILNVIRHKTSYEVKGVQPLI